MCEAGAAVLGVIGSRGDLHIIMIVVRSSQVVTDGSRYVLTKLAGNDGGGTQCGRLRRIQRTRLGIGGAGLRINSRGRDDVEVASFGDCGCLYKTVSLPQAILDLLGAYLGAAGVVRC